MGRKHAPDAANPALGRVDVITYNVLVCLFVHAINAPPVVLTLGLELIRLIGQKLRWRLGDRRKATVKPSPVSFFRHGPRDCEIRN